MADNLGSMVYKISADGTELSAGMNKASADIQRFANTTNSQSGKIGEAFKSIKDQASGFFSQLNFDGGLSGFAKSFATAAGPAGMFFSSIAVGAIAAGAAVSGVVKELNSINKLGALLGESPLATQSLLRFFSRTGMSQEDSQGALLKFESRVGELRSNPNADIGRSFRRIGINSDDIQSKTLGDLFKDIADGLSRVDDAMERNHISQELFGKSWRDLAPALATGRRGIELAESEMRRFGATQDELDRAGGIARRARLLSSLEGSADVRARNEAGLIYGQIRNAAYSTWLSIAGVSSTEMLPAPNSAYTDVVNAPDERRRTIDQRLATSRGEIFRTSENLRQDQYRLPADRMSEATRAVWTARLEEQRAAHRILLAERDSFENANAQRDSATSESGAAAAATPRRSAPISAGTFAAMESLRTWQQTAQTIGLTARQVEILNASQRGANPLELERLRTQDTFLTRLEREHAIRQRITQQINGARDGELAILGISADSLEAAKIIADVQTRRPVPGQATSTQEAINTAVADAMRAFDQQSAQVDGNLQQQQQLAEIQQATEIGNDLARRLIEAVQTIQGFGIAPIR